MNFVIAPGSTTLFSSPAKTGKTTLLSQLEEWSSDDPKPHPGTLARWLDRAVERGILKREGAGRKSDPCYFWLPENEGKIYGRREW